MITAVIMQMLLDVALGDEVKAWGYYNHIVKKAARSDRDCATNER